MARQPTPPAPPPRNRRTGCGVEVPMSQTKHITSRRPPARPDRGTPQQDGGLRARLCPRQHHPVLRMAGRQQPDAAGRPERVDLRRLPRGQPRPRGQHAWRTGDPDTRPGPDGDRQPGARFDTPGPLAGDGGARVRPAGCHHRAHPGTHDGRLRGRVCRREAPCRCHAEADTQPDAAGGRAIVETFGRRAHRGHRTGDTDRQALLEAHQGRADGGGCAVRHARPAGTGHRVARARRRRRGARAGCGLLAQGMQLARPDALTPCWWP